MKSPSHRRHLSTTWKCLSATWQQWVCNRAHFAFVMFNGTFFRSSCWGSRAMGCVLDVLHCNIKRYKSKMGTVTYPGKNLQIFWNFKETKPINWYTVTLENERLTPHGSTYTNFPNPKVLDLKKFSKFKVQDWSFAKSFPSCSKSFQI